MAMTMKQLNTCYKQAKRNAHSISDLWKQFKFEIFLLEQERSDYAKTR